MTQTILHSKRGRGPRNQSRRPSRRRRPMRPRSNPVGTYASDAWSLAQRTLMGLNQIRRMINVESKEFRSNLTTTATSQSGVITYVSGVAQGTDFNNRVGDSIKVQHITLTGYFTRAGTDGVARIILFRDTENQGASPVGSDLLNNTGSVNVVTSQINWFNHNPNAEKNRFVILFDEMVAITSNDTNVTFQYSAPSEIHARYRGTGGTSASAAEGALFTCIVTDQAANFPTCTYSLQLTYTDD